MEIIKQIALVNLFTVGNDSVEIIDDPSEAILTRAAWLVVNEQAASVELFQKRLNVDYPVAVMLMNQLVAMEFIGPARGNLQREILATPEASSET
jgi:DNA segregation ATPase FtsK/SpoIIIE-like protein